MKKISLFLFFLLALFGLSVVDFSAVAQTKFYYDGIGFDYEKGWKINNFQRNDTSFVNGFSTSAPMSFANKVQSLFVLKSKDIGISDEEFFEKLKSFTISQKRLKVKYISEITDRKINGIVAKSIDIEYKKNGYLRVYRFTKSNFEIQVILSSNKLAEFDYDFWTILNSFTFENDSN